MKPYIYSKLLLKTITMRLLLFLLVGISVDASSNIDGNCHGYCHDMAVIKDPIIEMNKGFPAPDNLPISPDVKSCRRAHQGLFNELVECVEQQGDQVKIAYDNIIYGFDAGIKKAFNTFWTYKKHIIPLQELQGDILQTIPNPHYAQEPTIVLIYPWQKFSVGTRFKRVLELDTQAAYAIVRADYTENTATLDFVPYEDAIPEIKQDPQQARKLFVKIINDLIDRVAQSGLNNVIPYAWGGSSFVSPYIHDGFYQKDGAWHREGKNDPYAGYDCSELVMRMAQIAGIEFLGKHQQLLNAQKEHLMIKIGWKKAILFGYKGMS